eukprot:scaffold39012_cov191-Amphora_coffeaeformis.AAC.3
MSLAEQRGMIRGKRWNGGIRLYRRVNRSGWYGTDGMLKRSLDLLARKIRRLLLEPFHADDDDDDDDDDSRPTKLTTGCESSSHAKVQYPSPSLAKHVINPILFFRVETVVYKECVLLPSREGYHIKQPCHPHQ